MPSTDSRPAVLFVVADCPGHFVATSYRLARYLRDRGIAVVFAVTSPYYETFKRVDLSQVGHVHYLSEFLKSCPDGPQVDQVELDYWLTHATFVRSRFFWGEHPNPWSSYKKTVLFFRQLLDRTPNLVAAWSEIPSNATISIGHAECTRRGVPFLGYISGRIPDHFNVAIDRYATELMPNPSPPAYVPAPGDAPEYMKTALAEANRSPLERLGRAPLDLVRAVRARAAPSLETGQTGRYQVRAAARLIARKLYHKLVPAELFSPMPERDSSGISILFPLHYRPEASTSAHARFYENDADTVRNIAFSLPPRAKLYVKEHPAAIGSHSRAFFRELLAYPNVRLLAESPPLSDNLHRFDAVVTLTSTAGFEAICRGIPVLLLGRTFYESYPNVTRIQSWDQLGSAMAALEPGAEPRPDPEPMKRYLTHCFVGTFNYLHPAILHPDNIHRLAQPLLGVVGERG